MSAEQDILRQMSPDVRRRIEAEREKFEPFLGLLSAWKAAIDEQLAQTEKNVTDRLAQELFPKGDWHFPCQTVAVPETLRAREVSPADLSLTDPTTRAPWTPCGTGWTLPSAVVRWDNMPAENDEWALLFDLRYEPREPGAPLLTPQGGQLALVCGTEAAVRALADARWAIQYPGQRFQPVLAERYAGYLEFEQEIGVARQRQSHLQGWAPPCHPYSRKFLRFYQPGRTPGPFDADEWTWFEPEAEPGGEPGQARLVALLDEATASELLAGVGEQLLLLNAVPVAQMAELSEPIVSTLHRVGDSFQVTFSGISNFFAAVARAGHVIQPASLTYAVTDEIRATEETLYDAKVTCDQTAAQVRIYYNCMGLEATPDQEPPESLNGPRGERFSVPLPLMDGMNVANFAKASRIARSNWYYALVRPRLLTEGDVLELLEHRPMCRAYFDLSQASIQLDVENQPWVEQTPWDTYLWPTAISERSLLQLRMSYLTASRVPITPVMRVWLRPKVSTPQPFLMDDIARYAAAVLSRYFMVGWYRVEARVAEQW